jgi:glycolate oxidase FAD binding subunit
MDHRRFIIDGREPHEVVFPESVEQVAETLRLANDQQRAVAPVGLGAFLHLGGAPRKYELALSLQRLQRIVDYQPTDMTVTVEAGLSLAQLQRVLGEHGQWLSIDPPLAEQATIGGIIAANLSGPARLSQGTIRDSLLGLKAVRTDGTQLKGGGRVVKNVAGYDIPKLFCGSFGTLGVIVEATFKVRPRPEVQEVLALPFATAAQAMEAAFRCLDSEVQPFFLELTNVSPLRAQATQAAYFLVIGFAGIAEEGAYQSKRVRELAGAEHVFSGSWKDGDAAALAQTLQNFPAKMTTAAPTFSCKVSVLPNHLAPFCQEVEAEAVRRGFAVHLQAHAGNGIVFLRFTRAGESTADDIPAFVDWLRVLGKRLNGYVVIEEIDPSLKERVDVWGHVGGALPLMKRLKETFDPNGILNPGRFVGGL